MTNPTPRLYQVQGEIPQENDQITWKALEMIQRKSALPFLCREGKVMLWLKRTPTFPIIFFPKSPIFPFKIQNWRHFLRTKTPQSVIQVLKHPSIGGSNDLLRVLYFKKKDRVTGGGVLRHSNLRNFW